MKGDTRAVNTASVVADLKAEQGWSSRRAPAACLVVLIVASGAGAQDADSDLRDALQVERQRLSEQMLILQQQMAEYERQKRRLDELEAQLSNRTSTAKDVPDEPAAKASGFSVAGLLSEPKDKAVQNRIEIGENEARDSHVVLTAQELVASDFSGSWPMFGTDYRMKLGGYVKLDALYDFDGAGDKTQFRIAEIPVKGPSGEQNDGYFNMFARETRFNIDVRGGAEDAPAQQVFIEMDFFDETSFSPRLRHAYAVYGPLLFGQTWSTVVELASIPYTIDFSGGDAVFGARNPQVRWQQSWNEEWSWAVALENLGSPGIDNPSALPGEASALLPMIASRLTHSERNGVHSLALQLQQLSWDGGGRGPDDSVGAWALIYAGRNNFNGGDFFSWNLSYGDGTPENIMLLTGSQANAVLGSDGKLITRKGFNIALGYGHKWTPNLASNISFAYTGLEDLGRGLRAPDAIQSGSLGHVNLIWTEKNVSTGIEFMWGNRENSGGDDGSARRIQAMFKFGF